MRGRGAPGDANTRGRGALWAAHALFVVLLAGIWACVPTSAAHAYVDPSVMTYTIQAVAGVAVALSAVAGVAFRRTRHLVYRLLGVDEDAGKLAEPAVQRIDPHAPDAAARRQSARETASRLQCENALRTDTRAPRNLTWPKRFAFALVMCLFMAFIVFIAPALEIFGANGDSLVFPLPVVWWVSPLFCVPIAVGVAALLACMRGRAFYYALGAVFLLTLAAYVQSLFLNQGMMPADGGYVGWNEPYFIVRKVVSGIVWAAIIVVPLALLRFNFHGSLKAACAIACAIMVVQGVGVASVALDASKTSQADSARPYVTQGGLLSVSPESNVIVFVLDTYDTALLQAILQQDPGFLADFEDFTYFPDSVGTMIPTANAVPNLLTGLKPKPGQELGEYRRDKYAKGRFLGDIAAQGYSVGLYSDSLMMDFANPADRAAADLTMNVHPVSHAPIDVWRTFLVMEQCALYREAPWLLKEPFWYYTSNLNNRMIADAHDGDLGDSLYELDDAAILDLLHTRGLSADDVEGAGAFRFIHLFGPHFPYSVDEQGHDVGTNHSDQLAQAKGSMHVVSEYLAQLKVLGLYDQATIIVTADHGVWYITDDPPRAPISPIMLAKPARTAPAGVDEPAGAAAPAGAGDPTAPAPAGAAAPAESTAPATAAPATAGADEPAAPATESGRRPCAVSAAPVCHDDLQPTVIAAVGGDPTPYGTTLFQVEEAHSREAAAASPASARPRYFDALTNVGDQGQRFVEYEIRGPVSDLSSWHPTGNIWPGA